MKLKILGDWKGAREALKSTERGIHKLSTAAKSSFGKLGGVFSKVFSPLGFGLSGLGVTTVFTSIVNKLDDIGKASARMGVSSEYFQKMKFAAERTGSSIDQVNEAFGKVVAQVGKLAIGDENAKKIFDRMGLSKEDLAGLNNEQVFDKVNRAIAGIGDEQQRNAVKAQLYGESFLKLNNFLKDYIQLGGEAKSRGLIIDDATIKAAEGLKDAMTNAGTAFMAALAGSGVVEWLNDVAQNLDAAANIDRQKQDTGVEIRDTRSGFRRWAESTWGLGGFIAAANKQMFGMGESTYAERPISNQPGVINATPELLSGIGGSGNLGEYVKQLDAAKNSIADLTSKEAVYINNSGSFEEIERRKAELLKNRADKQAAADKQAQAEKDLDLSRAVTQSILGKTSVSEQQMLNEARTAEEVYAAIDKISEARDKENDIIDEKIKKLNQELKYQRMIEEGKAREVEIEKALEQAAPGGDVSRLTPEQRKAIEDAAGAVYDIRNPAKVAGDVASAAAVPFPTDSLRRIGGMSGAFNGSNPSLNYQKSSAESLGTIKNMVNDIKNNMTGGTAGAMQAP